MPSNYEYRDKDLMYFPVTNSDPISAFDMIDDNLISVVPERYLTSNIPSAGDYLGNRVAISRDGTVVAVGANDSDGGKGSVRIFTKSSTGWNHRDTIVPSAAVNFGFSLDLTADGNMLLVGDPYYGVGKVWLYEYINSAWSIKWEYAFTYSSGAGGQFGYAVSINDDGTKFVVSAITYNVGGDSGYIWSYVWNGSSYVNYGSWGEIDYTGLAAQQGKTLTMSSDGTTILIGSNGIAALYIKRYINGAWTAYSLAGVASIETGLSGDDTVLLNGRPDLNSVYIYTKNYVYDSFLSATLQSITPTGSYAGFNFGCSVSCNNDGSIIAVGARTATVSGSTNQGKVYIFTRSSGASSWTLVQEIIASNGASGDQFGYHVSISKDSDTLIVGAPYKTVNGKANAGASYAYEINRASRAIGVYTGETQLESPTTKYFAPLGGTVFTDVYSSGTKVTNRNGIEVGVSAGDRVCLYNSL